jgi:membrane protein DedA with SNARE-associated domain/rhodanese-related sulfurtransferase
MESLLSGISQHGYAILFAAVFLEAIGIPIPAALALLIAGAASGRGLLIPWLAAPGALSVMLLADILMFTLGRHTGWWLLGMLCRVSLNPESCILNSADSFYRRGRIVLLFAKFVPGINTMAPPLAGSMNMRFVQFLKLDFVGAFLYIGTYFSVGFLFSGALDRITAGYHAAAHVVSWILIALVAGYAGAQAWGWNKSRALRSVPSVTPAEAARALSADTAVIFDVRSHNYYDRHAMRVKGSRRLDPHALHHWAYEFPLDRPVYLYCTCIREATSARVAKLLLEKGIQGAVITGGLRAWKKAGLPLEPVPQEEMAALPLFN